jgi:hypothetical protein
LALVALVVFTLSAMQLTVQTHQLSAQVFLSLLLVAVLAVRRQRLTAETVARAVVQAVAVQR